MLRTGDTDDGNGANYENDDNDDGIDDDHHDDDDDLCCCVVVLLCCCVAMLCCYVAMFMFTCVTTAQHCHSQHCRGATERAPTCQ